MGFMKVIVLPSVSHTSFALPNSHRRLRRITIVSERSKPPEAPDCVWSLIQHLHQNRGPSLDILAFLHHDMTRK